MNRALLTTLLALATLTLACGTPPPPEDAGPQDSATPTGPTVVLGGGTSSFMDLLEGAPMELIAGPQGGHHVNVTTRLFNLEIEELLLDYEATVVGATGPISMPTQIELTSMRVVPEGAGFLRAGDFIVMNIEAPAEIVGMEIDLTVTATATDGSSASDTRRVVVVDEVAEPLPG